MPNALTRFFMGLIGRSWAYESVEGVREAIAKNSFDSLPKRAETYTKAAAGLSGIDALQPGLIEFHDDMHDGWHYLVALAARADELGCASLTDHLSDAADSLRDAGDDELLR